MDLKLFAKVNNHKKYLYKNKYTYSRKVSYFFYLAKNKHLLLIFIGCFIYFFIVFFLQ